MHLADKLTMIYHQAKINKNNLSLYICSSVHHSPNHSGFSSGTTIYLYFLHHPITFIFSFGFETVSKITFGFSLKAAVLIVSFFSTASDQICPFHKGKRHIILIISLFSLCISFIFCLFTSKPHHTPLIVL